MKTIKTLCRNFFRLILTGLDALTPDETEAYRPFGLSFEGRAGEKKRYPERKDPPSYGKRKEAPDWVPDRPCRTPDFLRLYYEEERREGADDRRLTSSSHEKERSK